MPMDAATKAKIMERISKKLDEDEHFGREIEKGRWEVFYDWLKSACADIWAAIKDYTSRIWEWVKDIFS